MNSESIRSRARRPHPRSRTCMLDLLSICAL
jgi:hypothetical protein